MRALLFDCVPYHKAITVMDCNLFALIGAFMCTPYLKKWDETQQNKSNSKKKAVKT